MMQHVHMKLNTGLHVKSDIQEEEEEEFFHLQIEEETSRVLNFKHGFL